MKHPLPILTAAFTFGIGLGIIVKIPEGILLLSAGALLITTLFVKGSRLFIFSSSLLFVAIGLLLITPKLYPKDTPDQTPLYDIPEYRNVTGTIKTSPDIFPDKTQIILSDIMTKEGLEWTPIRGKLRLIVYENIRDLRIGDRVFFYGRVRKPRNFNNPPATAATITPPATGLPLERLAATVPAKGNALNRLPVTTKLLIRGVVLEIHAAAFIQARGREGTGVPW